MNLCRNYSLSFPLADRFIDALLNEQLKKESYWDHFVGVFNTGIDDDTLAWRGEFFGKMMRGACLVYAYRKDEELYRVLTRAAENMLSRQDELGRFSTYSVEKEFNGWDIWCRKYVTTGLLHYYDICKDEGLKERIVAALRKHLDYIIERVGPGKIDICTTTNFWDGINSSSILEPVMNFYNITRDGKYLGFAKYLVERGGTLTENVIDLAYENIKKPYQYKVTKAYETMSYFEGVLEYYKVTKEGRLLAAVKNFVDAVKETDLTIVGSCGCTHELFDNSTIMQTRESDVIAQETCVTVTWIRLNTKLLNFTNDVKYFNNIESSFYNGMLGSVNSEKEKQCTYWGEVKYYDPMFFDSYSPLKNSHRGRGIGGFQQFSDGTYFGCCIAIGAAGMALFPLTAVMEKDGAFVINDYLEGEVAGNGGCFRISDGYLTDGRVTITIGADGDYRFVLRNPHWSGKTTLSCNGKTDTMSTGYNETSGCFRKGDTIEICFSKEVKPVYIDGSVAFTYAPLVLAYDQFKQHEPSPKNLAFGKNCFIKAEPSVEGELARFRINDCLFTDYQSCGKHYLDLFNTMSVWFRAD